MNTDKLVVIEINDETSLLEACDILHDGSFDLALSKFDAKAGIWSAIFKREFFEDPKLIRTAEGFLFSKFSFPMAKCFVELSGVKKCDVYDRSHIGTYSFNECQPYTNGYRFCFSEAMEIVFTFQEKPKGILRDMKLLDELGSFWRWRNPFRKRLTPKCNKHFQRKAPQKL